MKKVLLGISGGIDSTASAVILKEQGYDVTGLTFINFDTNNDALNKAKRVCDKLKIKHIVLDIKKQFEKEVISYFISEYEKGRTPNPCIKCNEKIKFGQIYNYAIENGYDYVATGHYALIATCNNKLCLKSALDKNKDQTYFLYMISEKQLKHILFPLGKLNKAQARDICAKYHLLPKESKESQEICFIHDNYKRFLTKRNAKNIKGNFIFDNKTIIKPHDGIINYTIGQRKGMNLAIGKPAYVIDIDPISGDVIIGDDSQLFVNKIIASNLKLINNNLPINEQIYAKIRYGAKKSEVTVTQIKNDVDVVVIFKDKQRAVTKGQSIVFYTNDYVIGGAIIEKGVMING